MQFRFNHSYVQKSAERIAHVETLLDRELSEPLRKFINI